MWRRRIDWILVKSSNLNPDCNNIQKSLATLHLVKSFRYLSPVNQKFRRICRNLSPIDRRSLSPLEPSPHQPRPTPLTSPSKAPSSTPVRSTTFTSSPPSVTPVSRSSLTPSVSSSSPPSVTATTSPSRRPTSRRFLTGLRPPRMTSKSHSALPELFFRTSRKN